MTINEYLSQREPCSVCDATGNTEYCITHMLSREDNCLFYNSVLNNGDSYDNADVLLMQNLRATVPGQKVLDYYVRSEPLVKKYKLVHGNDVSFWSGIYNRFIGEIINLLKAGKNDEAVLKIFAMLDTLETEAAAEAAIA